MGDFTFDDDTKDVLTESTPKRKQGRPQASSSSKKKKCVSCYLTEDEFSQLSAFLGGRPASVYLRDLILNKIKT